MSADRPAHRGETEENAQTFDSGVASAVKPPHPSPAASTLVERVARALAQNWAHPAQTWHSMPEHFRDGFRRGARVAIEAMHEPTGKMGDAGLDAFEAWEAAGSRSATVYPHGPIWRAMIAAALVEAG